MSDTNADSPLYSQTSEKTEAKSGLSSKTCFFCGAVEEPSKKLLRCSGCFAIEFCNATCQKAAWRQHKELCTLCKKVGIYAAAPLLAAMAFLPRMQTVAKALAYEVFRRELRHRELHLYLRNRGRIRSAPEEFDVSGHTRVGPSKEQLHNMVQHDGYLEAIVVGSLYGFHCALQQYNSRGHGKSTRGSNKAAPCSEGPLDYVTLVHNKGKIKEYGIAMGSTCPDYKLVYHVGDKVRQMQDPNNHVWMYFRTERSDRLFLDVGSLSYGMGLLLNVVDYLPEGTPESQIRQLTRTLGAPGNVLSRSDLDRIEELQAGAAEHLRRGYLADRRRFPVSTLTAEGEPEAVIRGLLQQLQQAALEQTEVAEMTTTMGIVAAAAVVTAAAAAVPTEAIGGGNGGSGGGGPVSPTSGVLRSSGGGGGGGKSGRRRVPFRDGKLDKHVQRAMLHFEVAFNNTYAVLQQGTYQRYPASLDSARSFSPWVNLRALGLRATTRSG